jgi:hypothetical protein
MLGREIRCRLSPTKSSNKEIDCIGPVEQRSPGLLLLPMLLRRGEHLDEAKVELDAIVEVLNADTFVLAMGAVVV